MVGDKCFKAGLWGSIIAAICCFTPVLVIGPPAGPLSEFAQRIGIFCHIAIREGHIMVRKKLFHCMAGGSTGRGVNCNRFFHHQPPILIFIRPVTEIDQAPFCLLDKP